MEHIVGFGKKITLVIELPVVLYYDIIQELFNFSAAEVYTPRLLVSKLKR